MGARIWKILERERVWSSCWGRPELVLGLGAFVCLFVLNGKRKVKLNFQKSFLAQENRSFPKSQMHTLI